MAQVPSNTKTSNSPPAEPELARSIAALLSSTRDGGCLTEPLSVITRGRLSNRLILLSACLNAASKDDLRLEVAKLMAAYPSMRNTSTVDGVALVHQYAEALSGAPVWAVRDACKAVMKGAVPDINPDFVPSSARLRQLVDGYMSAAHQEARNIDLLLDAPVVLPDNDEMAKKSAEVISAGFKSLIQKLDDDERAERLPQHQEAGTGFKPLQGAALVEHYKTHGFLFRPKPTVHNGDRNITGEGTVTVDDEYPEQAAGGR